jgi:hypothetical protein
LLQRARRRVLTHLVGEQALFGAAFFAAGVIILLLAGTQILNWWWPVALFSGAFAWGLYRTWSRVPGVYTVAQRLDHELALHDSLSTAFFFETNPSYSRDDVRAAQHHEAEEAARGVDLKTALPFRWPRFAWVTAALCGTALTLFGIRYGVTHSLDLKPSLVEMAFESLFSPAGKDVAEKKRTPWEKKIEEDMDKLGVQTNQADTERSDLDPGQDNAASITDTPDVNPTPNSGETSKQEGKTEQQQLQSEGKEGNDENEKGEGQENQTPEPGAGQSKKDGDQQAKDGQQGKNEQQSSLMDKMKDALQNMLNKMKMQPKGDQQQQQASNKDGQPQGQSKQKSDGKNQQGKEGQQQSKDGEAQDQKADGKEAQPGQKGQQSQAKNSDQNGQQQASSEAKSGMGKQDGNKDLRDAQEKAMGKLTELFGKRNQNLTGEIMIEVSSGKQNLKTQYSSKTGAHKESGGEINRDEVPLIYQHYVEKYFEQVRRGEAPKGEAAPAAKPTQTRPSLGATQ